jgi:hypothetical protein
LNRNDRMMARYWARYETRKVGTMATTNESSDSDADLFNAVRKILNVVSKLPQPLREKALVTAGLMPDPRKSWAKTMRTVDSALSAHGASNLTDREIILLSVFAESMTDALTEAVKGGLAKVIENNARVG